MKKQIKNLTLSAMFAALGMVLPMITGSIPQIGNMLLPMHIPVFFCGLICGWQYGLAVGAVLPVMRSLIFGMPPLYPVAAAMTFELAAYGFVSGFLYNRSKKKGVAALYLSIVAAMLAGRIVWGAAEVILLGIAGNAFTWKAFMAGAFLNAVPGIIIQLTLIPALMVVLDRLGLVQARARKVQTYRRMKLCPPA